MAEPIIFALNTLLDQDPQCECIIRIEASEDVRLIPPSWLSSPYLKAIEIDFPSFRDGRGFSSARILRSEMNYQGPLKAVGNVLKDQLFVMLRSGFDEFALKDPMPEKAIESAKTRFRHVYQHASDHHASIAEKRRGRS
jgi:uncharacterized protein (DUF934 family)